MNKIELYNKIVKVYKNTGQGTPTFVGYKHLVDELVEDGLVKIVTQEFSYLPNEVNICLTKGYCVEENCTTRDMSALTFMRIYLNLN